MENTPQCYNETKKPSAYRVKEHKITMSFAFIKVFSYVYWWQNWANKEKMVITYVAKDYSVLEIFGDTGINEVSALSFTC